MLARVASGSNSSSCSTSPVRRPRIRRAKDIHRVLRPRGSRRTATSSELKSSVALGLLGFRQRLRLPFERLKRPSIRDVWRPTTIVRTSRSTGEASCQFSTRHESEAPATRRGATRTAGSPTDRNTAAASRRSASLPARPNSIWPIRRSLRHRDRGPCPPLPARRIRRGGRRRVASTISGSSKRAEVGKWPRLAVFFAHEDQRNVRGRTGAVRPPVAVGWARPAC